MDDPVYAEDYYVPVKELPFRKEIVIYPMNDEYEVVKTYTFYNYYDKRENTINFEIRKKNGRE